MTDSAGLRVAVLGFGAIGARVSAALHAQDISGASLSGVISSTPARARASGYRTFSLDDALEVSDLVVECATVQTLRQTGPGIIRRGVDLLPASLGALADPELRHELIDRGPGRCFLTAGAIGGLDVLGAAAANGGLDRVKLTSTKRAATLAQPWMSEREANRLLHADQAYSLFSGSVSEAIERFPASLNVGAALATATGMWEQLRIELVADPHTALTHHRIEAEGSSGEYDFSIMNRPLPESPASSAVVSAALLRGVSRIARPSGMFL